MIREVKHNDIPVCVSVIRKSFQTVADELNFTEKNAPQFTAYATTDERLYYQIYNEHRSMYMFCDGDKICGYYSLLLLENKECELNNLAVLPEYRHNGIGKKLLEHATKKAIEMGCKTINIGIVEENKVLRKWYEQNGAIHIGTEKYDFFPFTCGYMKIHLDTN